MHAVVHSTPCSQPKLWHETRPLSAGSATRGMHTERWYGVSSVGKAAAEADCIEAPVEIQREMDIGERKGTVVEGLVSGREAEAAE